MYKSIAFSSLFVVLIPGHWLILEKIPCLKTPMIALSYISEQFESKIEDKICIFHVQQRFSKVLPVCANDVIKYICISNTDFSVAIYKIYHA